MKDQRVLAAINMFSVLRALEDLVKIDEDARNLIKHTKLTICFSVPSLPKYYLDFSGGRVKAKIGGQSNSDINLIFLNPSHFNKMIDGESMPIPTRGIGKINFLKNEFTELTDILQSYLIPEQKRLENDFDFRNKSTILTAYVAMFAAVQIGNYDRHLNELVRDMPDGIIRVGVDNSIGVSIRVHESKMVARVGKAKNSIAFMDFSSLDILGGILRSELDSYACIGRGELSVRGKMHMIDNFNKILGSVSKYL